MFGLLTIKCKRNVYLCSLMQCSMAFQVNLMCSMAFQVNLMCSMAFQVNLMCSMAFQVNFMCSMAFQVNFLCSMAFHTCMCSMAFQVNLMCSMAFQVNHMCSMAFQVNLMCSMAFQVNLMCSMAFQVNHMCSMVFQVNLMCSMAFQVVTLFPAVVVSEGREEDRLYQVMSDGEMIVGDMPLDGILVLEVPESDATDLAKQDSYTQLVSPMQESKPPPSYRHLHPCSPQAISSKQAPPPPYVCRGKIF